MMMISKFHNNVTSDNSEGHSKTQSVVSESYNTFSNKLNRNKSSGITCNEENESLPNIIDIPNIATTTSVEPAMTTIVTVDDILNDNNLMKFFLQTIDQLEVIYTNFDDFQNFMKSSYDSYSLKYNPFARIENYGKAIEKLFKNHSTMNVIIIKMELKFPLDTQDVLTQDDIVIFVPKNKYSEKLMIVGGSCILNDKMNSS